MNRLALLLFVPALLLVAMVVARLVCRACDAAEKPEQAEAEPRSMDAEFAAIVAASLADLERTWRDE